MKNLTNILTALHQYLKQYHLLAKGYENHLLAERLDEGMSESLESSIDRLKELALGMGGTEAYDILCLIEDNKREGWYIGRKNYWEKHLDSVKEKLNKIIEWN